MKAGKWQLSSITYRIYRCQYIKWNELAVKLLIECFRLNLAKYEYQFNKKEDFLW
jgi:hypothetical protein